MLRWLPVVDSTLLFTPRLLELCKPDPELLCVNFRPGQLYPNPGRMTYIKDGVQQLISRVRYPLGSPYVEDFRFRYLTGLFG
jgi:hypothetical protein